MHISQTLSTFVFMFFFYFISCLNCIVLSQGFNQSHIYIMSWQSIIHDNFIHKLVYNYKFN